MIKESSVIQRLHTGAGRALVPAVVALLGICVTSPPGGLAPSNRLNSSAKAQTNSQSSPAGLPDFADIVERVKPAVVGVNVQVEEKTTGRQQRRLPGEQDSPFASPGERPGMPQRR